MEPLRLQEEAQECKCLSEESALKHHATNTRRCGFCQIWSSIPLPTGAIYFEVAEARLKLQCYQEMTSTLFFHVNCKRSRKCQRIASCLTTFPAARSVSDSRKIRSCLADNSSSQMFQVQPCDHIAFFQHLTEAFWRQRYELHWWNVHACSEMARELAYGVAYKCCSFLNKQMFCAPGSISNYAPLLTQPVSSQTTVMGRA